MDKLLPYFSFRGRTNRQSYWLTLICSYMALVVIGFACFSLISIPVVGAISGLIFVVVIVGSVWLNLATVARRMHDRNRSAWWLLATYLPMLLLSVLASAANAVSDGAGLLFSLLSLPFALWLFIELGCLKGSSGSNQFGEDPLQTPAVAFS